MSEQAAIERFTRLVRAIDPKLSSLLRELEQGSSAQEILASMLQIVQAEPELAAKIKHAADEAFAELRQEEKAEIDQARQALKRLDGRQQALADLNFSEEDLVFDSGVGLPQLHPKVAAYIYERLQFDDDIPELRTDDLPLGVAPAVPVETQTRDPVVLGMQLEKASQAVRKELDAGHAERAKQMSAALEPGENSLQKRFNEIADGRVDIPGYQAGRKAVSRTADVETQDLAILDESQRKKYAYKALSSTQGRRSAAPVIGDMVREALLRRGYEVRMERGDHLMEQCIARHAWTCTIQNAAAEVQSRFSYVETAAAVLATQLHRQLSEKGITSILLLIRTVDRVSMRFVGWEAQAAACQ